MKQIKVKVLIKTVIASSWLSVGDLYIGNADVLRPYIEQGFVEVLEAPKPEPEEERTAVSKKRRSVRP